MNRTSLSVVLVRDELIRSPAETNLRVVQNRRLTAVDDTHSPSTRYVVRQANETNLRARVSPEKEDNLDFMPLPDGCDLIQLENK